MEFLGCTDLYRGSGRLLSLHIHLMVISWEWWV